MYLFTLLADKWWKHLELNIFFFPPTHRKVATLRFSQTFRRRNKHLIKRLKCFTAYHCVLGDMGSAVLFLQADREFWRITHLSLLVSYLITVLLTSWYCCLCIYPFHKSEKALLIFAYYTLAAFRGTLVWEHDRDIVMFRAGCFFFVQ